MNNEVQTINDNNAMFECTKNVELALSLHYDDLESFSATNVIDGITYNTSINVIKYSDSFITKEDYIKIIEAETKYIYNGQTFTYSIDTIKKKVL